MIDDHCRIQSRPKYASVCGVPFRSTNPIRVASGRCSQSPHGAPLQASWSSRNATTACTSECWQYPAPARRTRLRDSRVGRAAEALSALARSRAIVGPVMLGGMPAPLQWASSTRASQWLVPTAYSSRTRLESSCRADAEPPLSTIALHTDKGDQPPDESRPRAPYLLDSGQQPMEHGNWRRQFRQTGSVETERWI